jgi:hypothetical protein
VQEYLRKEDEEMLTNVEITAGGRIETYWDEMNRRARIGDIEGAMEVLREYNPAYYVKNFTGIRRQLAAMGNLAIKRRNIHDFRITLEIMEFVDKKEYKTKTLILWGRAGTGKTKLAGALGYEILAREKKEGAMLLARHKDDLKVLNSSTYYQGVVVDDQPLSEYTREELLNLFDVEEEGKVHARYEAARLPAGMIRIVTTNLEPWQYIGSDTALIRRVKDCEVKESLYKYTLKQREEKEKKEQIEHTERGLITLPQPENGTDGKEN